jgi:hypothetical protein
VEVYIGVICERLTLKPQGHPGVVEAYAGVICRDSPWSPEAHSGVVEAHYATIMAQLGAVENGGVRLTDFKKN